jgi:GxxExxY protein
MQTEKRDPRTYAIIGAAMEVHRELGCGFLEAVYQQALAAELILQNVPAQREVLLQVQYKGALLDATYRVDFVCFDEILVEVKALARLSSIEEAQLLNYLKATGMELGLLLNFGAESLEYKRLIHKRSWNNSSDMQEREI